MFPTYASTTTTSATPVPMPYLGMTSGTVGHAPCGKECKKCKRDVAVLEDKSDALFEGSGARERIDRPAV